MVSEVKRERQSPAEHAPMRVFVIAHALRAAGGRATCMNLLKALTQLDEKNHYFLLLPDQPQYRALKLEHPRREVRYYHRKFSHPGRWFFDTFILPRLVNGFRPDLVWSMSGVGLPNPPCVQAVSIQNSYVMYDSTHTGKMSTLDSLWLFFLKRAFARQLPRTQLVFCQTPTMKQRLYDVYGFQGKAVVTWKAVSAFLQAPEADLPAPLLAHSNAFKLFYVTRYYPHKGLEILVEAMDRFRESLAGTLLVLTIEAGQHPHAAALLGKIQENDLEKSILNVGPLAQEELAPYYRHCDALVMPTRLESFSGTYLEAMHFGMPILTSDLDFAHEICLDAAIYFDPWSAESIRDAILKVKQTPELGRQLAERGRERLREMEKTWDEIAQQVLNELRELHRSESAKA